MPSMEDLYQEIILEHNKRPYHFGPLPEATHHADGLNPLCGDQLHISLHVRDGRLEKVFFQGQGCAISKASASLMALAMEGRDVSSARELANQVVSAIKPGGDPRPLKEAGDLAALSGVRAFPARVKCATLAWHALLSALEKGGAVSTEGEGS